MKNTIIVISLLAAFLMFNQNVNAIDNLENKENFEAIGKLLKNKSFVLEADWLEDTCGNRVYISPDINFVKVDSSRAVLQIGSNQGFGYNGLGGVTADGSLTKMKITKNEKKLFYNIDMTFMTSIGIYDVNMFVDSNGWAQASVTGLRRGKLTYRGKLVSTDNSRIFKGSSTY